MAYERAVERAFDRKGKKGSKTKNTAENGRDKKILGLSAKMERLKKTEQLQKVINKNLDEK